MADFKHKPGNMALFKNDRKEEETHADYAGAGCLPDGTEVWVNAWVKTKSDGEKFFSISVKPKQAKAAPDPLPPIDPLDDDAPF